MGQFHLIPTALIVVAVAALRARRELLAGVLVGLALTKPTLALPFLGLLAAQRYFRALGAAVGVQGLLLVAASGWLWASPTRLIGQWLHRAQGQETAGLVDVPSLLGRAWPGAPVGSAWVTLGLLALTIALCYVWRRRSELGLVAFCGFAGAIMVYHRPYDLVLLVPAMALLVERARTGAVAWNWHRLAVAGLFCGLLVVPNDPIVREGWETAYDAVFTVLLYAFLLMVTLELGQESSRAGGGPAEARVCLDS